MERDHVTDDAADTRDVTDYRPPRGRTGRPCRIDWDADGRLGTMTDDALGLLVGLSSTAVAHQRRLRGIASFTGRVPQARRPLPPPRERPRDTGRPCVVSGPLTPSEIEDGKALWLSDEELAARPRTRGDCVNGPRPCPWAGCRYHLGVEVTVFGSLQLPHGHDDVTVLTQTCALDMADSGQCTLEETGIALGVTRERIRQVETSALESAQMAARKVGIEWFGGDT